MDTTSLGTTFPFTTASLTSNQGVLYGINEHDGSLVVFDRFSLENANSVVFGKSGVGKSFLVKLEAMRSLIFDTEVFILDPEGEYKDITASLGGEYIEFSYNAPIKINPFDLSGVVSEGENELGLKILSLHALMKVVMGQLDSTEEALLDRALVLTYKQKGITPDPQTQKGEPPLLEDLYKTLLGMEDQAAQRLAERLEKFIKGSLAGIFNQQSNLDIKNPLTVFCIRDLESELRPIAMFIILDFIWTKVKRILKKRILIVDEAWYLMKQPESANFLYGIAKRARKYYLGLTTITQDVEDFINTDHGKAIVTNSTIQILLKQSPASIDKIAEVFYLSGGEKHFVLSCDVGEGLFFAGSSHVAIRVVASPEEYELVTSKPQEVIRKQPEIPSTPSGNQTPYQTPVNNPQPAPNLQAPGTTINSLRQSLFGDSTTNK
jgi:type IV secretory pathway VirB4 component